MSSGVVESLPGIVSLKILRLKTACTHLPVLDGDEVEGADWLVKLSRGHWQGGSTQGIAGLPLIDSPH